MVEALWKSRKVTGSIPDGVIFISHWLNLSAALWPWVDSAFNINEYQEYLQEVKAAGARGWPYRFHVPIV